MLLCTLDSRALDEKDNKNQLRVNHSSISPPLLSNTFRKKYINQTITFINTQKSCSCVQINRGVNDSVPCFVYE